MAIDNYLVTESGRITYDIYNRTMFTSPWIRLPRKKEWPQRMGSIVQNVMWERAVVNKDSGNVENDWAAVDLNDDTGNSCIPPVDEVSFKQTLRPVQLYHKAVHSPRFCVNDLLFTAAREQQMESVLKTLADQVRQYWIQFNREHFTNWSNKYVIEGTLANSTDESTNFFPAVPSTSILTQGVLDYFYNLLTVEQGGQHQITTQSGRPIFGLISDQLTLRKLVREDPEIREDFRYSSQKDLLLKPLGIRHTYNGYVYMMDEMPRRFNFNQSDASDSESTMSLSTYTDPWEEVPPYVYVANKRIVNPAWLTAEYQDSYIWAQNAFNLRVPGQVTGIPRAEFKTQNYMGDYKWLNVANDDEASDAYNPDGTLGRFRGVLMAAPEAINPHVMFTLRHKVCEPDLGLTDCASV